MKKTILALSVASALGTSFAAQAATSLYEDDKASLGLYGRIALAFSGGGLAEDADGKRTDEVEFRDAYSRLGLHGNYQLNPGLEVYANVEFRFDASAQGESEGIDDVRESFIGIRSERYGVLQAGNYDGMYKEAVIAPFSPYIDIGREFTSGDFQSLGDSLAYISPTLYGFTGFLQGKLYSGNGTEADSEDSTQVNTQGGIVYENDTIRLAAGYAQDKEGLAGGIGENVYGATVVYQVAPSFAPRIGYETQENNEDRFGIGGKYQYGNLTAQADYYLIDLQGDAKQSAESRDEKTEKNTWVVGLYYNFTPNFDVFAEFVDSDRGTITLGDGVGAVKVDDSLQWISGARYFF